MTGLMGSIIKKIQALESQIQQNLAELKEMLKESW